MKRVAIIDGGIITNIIVLADDSPLPANSRIAELTDRIGNFDHPAFKNLASENALLKQQLKTATQQNEFLEDCIAEMATIIYE